MILQHLYEVYGMSCYFDRTSTGTWLRTGGWTIYPTPQAAFHEGAIEALAAVSDHLLKNGEQVGRILRTKNGELSSNYQGEILVFLAAPTNVRQSPWTGESIADFHNITQFDQSIYSPERPYLNWATLWQKRADQVYSWIEESTRNEESTEFERAVMDHYPYFSGRTENAIQYVVDLMIDAHVDEGACFCHNRIRSSMWKDGEGEINWPTEWVIDHPGRDLGEWLRSVCWVSENPVLEGGRFIEAYRTRGNITKVGASLAYSRILFPFPFMETVEGYYTGNLNEEEALKGLEACSKMSEREEALLSQFNELGLEPIVEVDWLKKVY